jgi:flavin reductase (DIM6/NTAB) family NADH-FMN oxidoreductase RutF
MIRTVAGGSMIRTGEAELRKSFACLAAGVAIIAVRGARGTPLSLVARSFNSVSLEPPLLLWSAAACDLAGLDLGVNSACGVSILSDVQGHLAEPGRCGPEAHWECGDCLGVPLLARAAATFEVVVTRCLPQGSDMLCFAEVARFGYRPGQSGALRFVGEQVDFAVLA